MDKYEGVVLEHRGARDLHFHCLQKRVLTCVDGHSAFGDREVLGRQTIWWSSQDCSLESCRNEYLACGSLDAARYSYRCDPQAEFVCAFTPEFDVPRVRGFCAIRSEEDPDWRANRKI